MRETWVTTLVFGLGLMAIEALLAYVLATFQNEVSGFFLNVAFVRRLLETLVGVELGDRSGEHLFLVLPWVHPVVLLVVWAHEITFCARLPAGEIDRGTVDLLLGLPVSRTRLYLCESLAWTFSGVVLLLLAMLGNRLGTLASPDGAFPDSLRRLAVLINLYGLYLAIGGFAFLKSSLSDRRGRAVGAVFVFVVASFLLNFVAQWKPAESVRFLGVLNYYRPFVILRGGGWPLGDIAILFVTGVVAWGAGAIVFRRRDICTV